MPTRVRGRSVSTLDLFLVSDKVISMNPSVHIFEEISDHKRVTFTMELKSVSKLKQRETFVLDFYCSSDVDILDELGNASFLLFPNMNAIA